MNTYAATVIEKLLTVKDGRVPRFGPADVKPFVERVLSEEFKLLERSESEDNDYIMKSLMRILSVASPKDVPLDLITQKLLTILTRITKKPATPIFNHYLFECIASLAKSISIANPAHIIPFENFILPTFNSILQNDINSLFLSFSSFSSLLSSFFSLPLSPPFLIYFISLLSPSLSLPLPLILPLSLLSSLYPPPFSFPLSTFIPSSLSFSLLSAPLFLPSSFPPSLPPSFPPSFPPSLLKVRIKTNICQKNRLHTLHLPVTIDVL